MAKLIDLCSKGSSNIAQKDLAGCEGQYPIYGAAGFIKNVDFYHQNKPYIAIVKDGAGVGRVMKLPANSSVIGTMQYIIPNEGVNVSYLAYALEHMNLAKYYLGAAIPHIYFKDYCNEELPAYTTKEQNNIAISLDKVTELITLRQEQLAKLDQLVKSRFIELFGDPVTNSMGWNTDTVNNLCQDIYGGGTPSKAHPEYYENGDIPWVSSKDMKTDILYDSQIKINQLGVDNSTAKMVPVNSVIMVIRSGILKHTLPVAINAVPITVNQDLKVFVPSYKISPVFLLFLFKMLEKDILTGVRVVTADNIEFNTLKERLVIVPPIALQEQFAAFVEQTDKSKFDNSAEPRQTGITEKIPNAGILWVIIKMDKQKLSEIEAEDSLRAFAVSLCRYASKDPDILLYVAKATKNKDHAIEWEQLYHDLQDQETLVRFAKKLQESAEGYDWTAVEASYCRWGTHGWIADHSLVNFGFWDNCPSSPVEADRAVMKHITAKTLRRVMEEIRTSTHKAKVFEEVCACFENKFYHACVSLLFSLIDGELISSKANSILNNRKTGAIAGMRVIENMSIDEMYGKPGLFHLELLNYNAFIDVVFERAYGFQNEPSHINRNYLHHGMSKRKVRRKDCIKLFLAYKQTLQYAKNYTEKV